MPLIISPYFQPPKAVTLPVNYTKLPSSLPPAVTITQQDVETVQQNIIQVKEFMETTRNDLLNEYQQWKSDVESQEVKEKRRIAPGYLDSGNRLLQPVKRADSGASSTSTSPPPLTQNQELNEIDKVFGKVSIS